MGEMLCKGDNVVVNGESVGVIDDILPDLAAGKLTYVVTLKSGLIILAPGHRLRLIPLWAKTCECGSNTTPGHANAHSYWCPAFGPR